MNWPLEYQAKDGRPIRVRPAAYGDAPALHQGLLGVTGEGVHLGLEPAGVGDLAAMIERLRAGWRTPRTAQLVAEWADQVAGAVSIRPGPYGDKDRHHCRLELWVEPGGRGAGLGTALMAAALAWAREAGFEKAIAEVFASNQPAVNLCLKFGFETEGRQKNLVVLPGIGYVDNILMGLELNRPESDRGQ